MPLNAGAEALASYLRGSGIRYLLWDYGSQAHFSHEEYGSRLGPDENSLVRSEARLTFDFQDNADVLMRTYTTSYNRDGLVLIDLQRPAP
jgi:hypothetical protein